jgi:cytoskeletal protein RodZ
MAEEADDFDQHFGGAVPAEDGEKSDATDGDESADSEEGGSEEDEEDFSKEWGDLPDDPVKFGGGGSAVKKAIRVGLMVLIGFGVPAVIVAVLYFTGTLESIQDSMNSSDEEIAAEESPDKEKKKKKRSRKGKKKKKSKSSALKSGNGSGGDVNQDWEIDYGDVRVSIKGKAELWVDGVSIGKVKKKKLKLSAGNHLFRAKMGKKKIAVQGTVAKGGTFLLNIDFKKMKSSFDEKSGRKRKR